MPPAAEDAADICTAVLSGRDVADPAGYLRVTLGNKRRARELLPAANSTTPTPPATTALCRRCSRPGHDAEHCPTLAPGASARPADATDAADAARKSLANRQRPLGASRAQRLPDPQPGPWPADDPWPDAADTADDDPGADDAADDDAADDADEADIPF